MGLSNRKRSRERIVMLMKAGRYGRACREFHRLKGTSVRLLKGKEREDWCRRATAKDIP